MDQEENNLFQKKSYYANRLNIIYNLVLGNYRNNSPYLISDKKRRFYQDILNAIDNFDEEPVILSLNNINNIQKKQHVYIAINQLRNELNNSSTRQEDIQIIREIAEEIASYNPEPLTQNVPWTLLTPNNHASNYNNMNNNNSIIEPGAPQKRGRQNNGNNNGNDNNRRTRRRLTFPDPPSLSSLPTLPNNSENSQEGGKRRAKKTRKQRKQRKQKKTQRKHR